MSGGMRFVGPYERALYLRTLKPIQDIGAAELAAFADYARERRYRPGAAILREGEAVPSVHVVVEGRVRVRRTQTGFETDMGPGEAVGFLALLTRSNEGLDAVAQEETLTLELERDLVFELLEESFPALVRLVRMLARRTLDERREIPDGAYLAPAEGYARPAPNESDLVDRILMVRRPGAPFEHTKLDAVVDLARFGREMSIPTGTTLWTSGDRADTSYMLLTGTVQCTTRGSLAKFRCGPGYPLGNLERLCDAPRWYTAVAETDLVVFHSNLDSFYDVVEDHSDMAIQFVTAMARNLFSLLSTSPDAAR